MPDKGHKVMDLRTDVLVLGAGAAGCLAAVGAREQGAEVIIVDKGSLISCGCTGAGQDHFGAQLNSGPEWDSDERATRYYSSPGWGVSSNLVEKSFTREISGMIRRLEKWGVQFYRKPDGSYFRSAGLGQPEWFLMMKNGVDLKKILAKQVLESGALKQDQITMTSLLKKGGDVTGAVGFNRRTGEIFTFQAKALVLALGAHQSRWFTNSTKMPYNIWQYPWNTGSQVVLPYEIGAKVKNLELCVLTTLPKGFGTPGVNAFSGMGARYLNARGEPFMEKRHPLGDRAPRGALIWAEFDEIGMGRGPLFIDCRHIPEKDLDHLINNLLPVDKPTFKDWLSQKSVNLKEDLLELELGEFSGGGNLHVDINMESVNIKCLFGLPFSGMLSTAMCGGLVAGREAGIRALRTNKLKENDRDQLSEERERIYSPLNRTEGYLPREFENKIRQVMEYYAGHRRSVRGLERALEGLRILEGHIDEIRARNYHELMQVYEARHLLKYCQLMIRSVLMRKGMKGFYTISDYPAGMDRELRTKYVVQWQESGEAMTAYEDID